MKSSVVFNKYSDIFLPVRSIRVSLVFSFNIGGSGPCAFFGHTCLPVAQEHWGRFVYAAAKPQVFLSGVNGYLFFTLEQPDNFIQSVPVRYTQ